MILVYSSITNFLLVVFYYKLTQQIDTSVTANYKIED